MISCIDQMSLIKSVQRIRSFILQLVMQIIQKCMTFIFMHKKLNMFKIKGILVFWVVFILICLLWMKHDVLSQLLSYLSCDTVVYMNMIRFSAKIIVAFLEIRDNTDAIKRLFNGILKDCLIFSMISATISH